MALSPDQHSRAVHITGGRYKAAALAVSLIALIG